MLSPLNRLRACLAVMAAMLMVVPDAHAQRRGRRLQNADAAPIRERKSKNFHVVTDLSERELGELLGRLETMLQLVSTYFGRPNPGKIQMYVIDDFDNWPNELLGTMDPDGVAAVRRGGGLTITEVVRNLANGGFVARATVYAGTDHGTPQHEAVHAYCGLAFGELGPVWYAEGMAEVGQYWRRNDKSVNADPVVIQYLRSEDPKPLSAIVDPLEAAGDWKDYSWRWALCHLLGFNENYAQRFKPLGLELLGGRRIDFRDVYGTQAREIDFEYRLFLQDLASGYRCDLCSWDWSTRFRELRPAGQLRARIRADRGWQASELKVRKDRNYAFRVTGNWRLERNGDDLTADGDEAGSGRLVGVVFSNYTLSEPFELGAEGTFTATRDGKLFLRCRDDWGAIADNNGTVRVELMMAGGEME